VQKLISKVQNTGTRQSGFTSTMHFPVSCR